MPSIHIMPVQPVFIREERKPEVPNTPVEVPPEAPTQSNSAPPSKPVEISRQPEPESKINFEKPSESKKEFDPEPENEENAPEFDRDSELGRWRPDELVRSLIIYRWEFKRWPDDLEDKEHHPTGIESYYEVRYFKQGANKKGESYGELYKKHRAKRDLWIDEESQRRAIHPSQVGLPEDESNVVHFPTRRTYRAH